MSKNSIYDILDFHLDFDAYASTAADAVPIPLRKSIQESVNELRAITKELPSFDDKEPSESVRQQALRKFLSRINYINPNDFTYREIRALIYCMSEFCDGIRECISFAHLLQNKWRDRFINGILYFLLNNWDSMNYTNILPIIKVFQNKLSIYEGKRDKFLILKRNARFFDANGPEQLGQTLRKKDEGEDIFCSLFTAPSVYLGLSNNSLQEEYYSRVIIAYFGKSVMQKLDLLKEVLQVHNYDLTIKRIIPPLIVSSKNEDNNNITELRSFAIKNIGNPEDANCWLMDKGTLDERSNLFEAREILRKWVKIKFIEIFFNICIRDDKRKKYWLKHIDWISDYEVRCTPVTFARLMSNKSLTNLLDEKVKIINENSKEDMSAFYMRIGSYVFIEFSHSSCLYMLERWSPNGKKVLNDVHSFEEIKGLRLGYIQQFFMKDREGRIRHDLNWEELLEQWMKKHNVL